MGLFLVRDAIAMREAQAHGLVIANRVAREGDLSFICLAERAGDLVIMRALEAVWR
jgi:hypothetical protein